MIDRIKVWWAKATTPIVSKIAEERYDLACQLEGLEGEERYALLESVSPELYASWLQVPYPSDGDIK